MKKKNVFLYLTVLAVLFACNGCARVIGRHAEMLMCIVSTKCDITYETNKDNTKLKYLVNGQVDVKFKICDGKLFAYAWEMRKWMAVEPPPEYANSKFVKFELYRQHFESDPLVTIVDQNGERIILYHYINNSDN